MKPAVLLVGNFLSSTGLNRTVGEDLAWHLEDVNYLTITTSDKRSRWLRLLDMLVTVVLWRQAYQIAYVEVFSGLSFIWAELVCGLLAGLRKPFILTLHGGNLPIFSQRWPGRVNKLLKRASAVTAPSSFLQEAMRPYRDDILLISNPLEIERYPFHLRSTPRPSLIWLRAFHNIYNPSMLPLVIKKLRAFYPDIILTMIGPDKGDGALEETEAIINKLGLQRNIKIVPGIPKSEVPTYLDDADVFINSTNVDNTPVSVLEAMACGLCVVSTNVGGIPYLLDHEINAFLVPPDDSDAITNAVQRILTEPRLSERLSANARKKVEGFDWSVILPQWEKTFFDIMRDEVR